MLITTFCFLQRFRCRTPIMFIHQTKKQPLLMCNRCDLMKDRKLFKNSPFRNRDSCLLCGCFCGGPGGMNTIGRAYTCQNHSAGGGLSNGMTERCWFCDSVIFLNNKLSYFELRLCMKCSQIKSCIKLTGR